MRQAARGRIPSQLRITEAIEQGREVPDLEKASRNLRKEEDDAEKSVKEGVLTGKERRRQERDRTDIERNDAAS